MGRRKIEIRPIKDDRNRSVTFLKRKGGLFKKAYELGVLCQVDVAVIIFGNNRKLHTFCSGDINDTFSRYQFYDGPHEHKGPADFAGKGGGDDDEDEEADVGSPPADSNTPPEPAPMANNVHSQPGLQYIRHATPSNGSPPMPNVAMPQQHRGSTPQPPGSSRPASMTALPRRTSNLVPPHQQYPPPQANIHQHYGYASAGQFLNPQQTSAPQQTTMPAPAHPPQHQQTYPAPSQAHLHHAYLQEQRRSSVPASQPSHSQPASQLRASPQPQFKPEPELRKQSPGPEQQGAYNSPPLPQPKPLSSIKSHSIFTPIDDRGSLLAQHWGAPPSSESLQTDPSLRTDGPHSQSMDAALMTGDRSNGASSQPPSHAAPFPAPQRTASTSSIASINGPSRTSTMQSEAKRPRLKVQIPSETSDGEPTADSSDRDTAGGAPQNPPQKGVVLPPPSPSNNTILSAGASGPPNPFARPAPPHNQNLNRDQLETPLSALPSRVMDGNMLPSPSDLWQTMFTRSNNDNMMPSPLRFEPTPIQPNGPSFRDELPQERKRSAEHEAGATEKRLKT